MTPLPRLVSCDPDTTAPTYAYFQGGELVSVTHELSGPRVAPPYPRELLVVIEAQWIDRASQVRDRDILSLAIAAGQSSMHFDWCEWVSPMSWKGNTSKAVSHAWVREVLSDAERAVLVPFRKKVLPEALDAVGIGLWKLGRMR